MINYDIIIDRPSTDNSHSKFEKMIKEWNEMIENERFKIYENDIKKIVNRIDDIEFKKIDKLITEFDLMNKIEETDKLITEYKTNNRFLDIWTDYNNTRFKRLMKDDNEYESSEVKKLETYKDLTNEEIDRRINDYAENPKDSEIVKNIEKFMKKFEDKDDIEFKRNEFIITKKFGMYHVEYERECEYEVYGCTTRKHSFRSGVREGIVEVLYMIDKGLAVWDENNSPIFINQI